MKKIYLVPALLLIIALSCKQKVNEKIETLKDTSRIESNVNTLNINDFIGDYSGYAKDTAEMELHILKTSDSTFKGYNIITWKKKMKAEFTGTIYLKDKKIKLYEDANVKNSGYFEGNVIGNFDGIEGFWHRYKDEGSYSWKLKKISSNNQETSFPVEEFISDFNSKDINKLKKYDNDKYGLFVLDNPGAFVVLYHFNSISEILNYETNTDIGAIKNYTINCTFQNGTKPVYSCESEKWNREGCFKCNVKNAELVKHLKWNLEFKIGNLTETQIEYAKTLDPLSVVLLYSTNSNIGFYFYKLEGKWYLSCIDKVTPCSA
jgi:hypothetical protein